MRKQIGRGSAAASARRAAAVAVALGLLAMGAEAAPAAAPSAVRKFNNTTQGPPWPPSTVTDVNGDFVVVGTVLTRDAGGNITGPHGAALVSKNTVPPLNNGVEDFSNFFGAPYTVIRPLDLRPNSPDLKTVLYAPSFGPVEGNFGGGPRIPAEGDSPYNLNAIGSPCPELFPGVAQKTYKRGPYALHQYPILGFQGDQVAYDVDSGTTYEPSSRSGTGCGAGCPGENSIDHRRDAPITLGEWLRARGELSIQLTRYNARVRGYTAARVSLHFRDLLPHSVYTAWGIRQNVLTGGRAPTPLALPGVFVTDARGVGNLTIELQNPFPARETDDAELRLVGVEISYHPDYQNWGACPERWGVGYRAMSWFDFKANGTRDLNNLLTVPAP